MPGRRPTARATRCARRAEVPVDLWRRPSQELRDRAGRRRRSRRSPRRSGRRAARSGVAARGRRVRRRGRRSRLAGRGGGARGRRPVARARGRACPGRWPPGSPAGPPRCRARPWARCVVLMRVLSGRRSRCPGDDHVGVGADAAPVGGVDRLPPPSDQRVRAVRREVRAAIARGCRRQRPPRPLRSAAGGCCGRPAGRQLDGGALRQGQAGHGRAHDRVRSRTRMTDGGGTDSGLGEGTDDRRPARRQHESAQSARHPGRRPRTARPSGRRTAPGTAPASSTTYDVASHNQAAQPSIRAAARSASARSSGTASSRCCTRAEAPARTEGPVSRPVPVTVEVAHDQMRRQRARLPRFPDPRRKPFV